VRKFGYGCEHAIEAEKYLGIVRAHLEVDVAGLGAFGALDQLFEQLRAGSLGRRRGF